MKCFCQPILDPSIDALDKYLESPSHQYTDELSVDSVYGVMLDGDDSTLEVCSNLQKLYLFSVRNVRLSGIPELNPDVIVVEAVNCSLFYFNTMDFQHICVLNLYDNCLKRLDVAWCYNLHYLNVYNNQLKALDVSALGELEQLICSSNELCSLSIADNRQLTLLCCGDNLLRSLALNDSLTYLECSRNLLHSLSALRTSYIKYISAYDNYLVDFQVADSIQYLDLSFNYLTMLNTARMPNLTSLYIAGNSISYLSVSKCTLLTELYVEHTKNNRESLRPQLKYAVQLGGFRGETDFFDYYEQQLEKPSYCMVELIEFRDLFSGEKDTLQALEHRLAVAMRQKNALLY